MFATGATLQGSDGRWWIRFSVANVDDETIAQVYLQLSEIEKQFGW
jgi:hypothetical protein